MLQYDTANDNQLVQRNFDDSAEVCVARKKRRCVNLNIDIIVIDCGRKLSDQLCKARLADQIDMQRS